MARSKQIAKVLGIADAQRDRACTSCHAPMEGMAAELWQPVAKVEFSAREEAVSCESCHGPASDWIRSHTRPDLTRSQKALDGLRDLNVFYNRANACVACHQVVDPKLLAAGHPELIFELDGQTSSMPRHWKERDPNHRLKAWLTGQAVALREVTAQVAKEKEIGEVAPRTFYQWQALLWVVGRAVPENKVAGFKTNIVSNVDMVRGLHKTANELAVASSLHSYTNGEHRVMMRNLTGVGAEFQGLVKGDMVAVTRAERLVLALQRLSLLEGGKNSKVEAEVGAAFELIQSRPDFEPEKFRERLGRIQREVEAMQAGGRK